MWVICGRNVALAVFASQIDALASLSGAGYWTDTSAHYSAWTNGEDTLTLVRLDQTTPFTTPMPLFQEQPAR